MRILLLSQTGPSYESKRLAEEALKKGIDLKQYRYTDIQFRFEDNQLRIKVNTEDIEAYDGFIFRSGKSKHGHYYGNYSGVIKQALEGKNKKILNLKSTNLFDNWSTKLYNYVVLATNNLPTIDTYNFSTIEDLYQNKSNLRFPLIAKEVRGSHGDSVNIIKSFEEISDYLNGKSIDHVLFQEFIGQEKDQKEDIRIITVGNKVLGAYKKIAPKNSIITNLAAGGNALEIKLTAELKEIAEKTAKAFEADFTGIDLIYKGDKPLILEINRAPQFKGFESITGVNVAEEIINLFVNNQLK